MRQVFVLQSFAMASCLLLALLVWARGPVTNVGIASEPSINVDLGAQETPIKVGIIKPLLNPEALKNAPAHLAQKDISTSSIYMVKPGDTLGHIAQRFKVTVAELKAMNNLQSDIITVGRELTVSQGQ